MIAFIDDHREAHGVKPICNVLPFRAPSPNALWVSDFTYVATWSGFAYVAFIIDAYARRSSAGAGSVLGGGGNSGFGRGVGLGWPSALTARVELRVPTPDRPRTR
jgi:hypothetical protein